MNVETPLGTLAAKVVEMPFVKPVKSQDCSKQRNFPRPWWRC
jgi:hypothetical protein